MLKSHRSKEKANQYKVQRAQTSTEVFWISTLAGLEWEEYSMLEAAVLGGV